MDHAHHASGHGGPLQQPAGGHARLRLAAVFVKLRDSNKFQGIRFGACRKDLLSPAFCA